jgi:hypothetical protein
LAPGRLLLQHYEVAAVQGNKARVRYQSGQR